MTKLPARAAAVLIKRARLRPTLAMVLGSGFGEATGCVAIEIEIPYADLPGFPAAGVGGHAGRLIIGTLGGTPVCILSGRAHYYEGHDLAHVTFPVRALAAFGITDLLLTNAAGGINRAYRPGDFMRLDDHINLMGVNPLCGPLAAGRERFVDLTRAYDDALGRLLTRAARNARAKLHRGVYLAVSGPSYETPAEIRAFARLGADAVGMSTVPETIVARQCGLRVAGLSCITNPAAGIARGRLTHAEVLATGERVRHTAAALLESFARLYGNQA